VTPDYYYISGGRVEVEPKGGGGAMGHLDPQDKTAKC